MKNSILVKTDNIKIPIIIIVVCSLIALSLFLVKSFVLSNSGGDSANQIVAASEQGLQSQINDLSGQISSLNKVVSQLQSQTKVITTQTDSQSNQVVLSKIDIMTTQNEQLTSEIDSLQAQMATMRDKLKAADTAIGTTPVNVNGLNVTFITDNIELGMTGASSPNAGQFAIKIANNTSSAFNNIDVTGTITSSQCFMGILAPGYPQLVDGTGLCSYVYYLTQDKTLNFEAYGSGKTSLSIPAGGSIIIRPKIILLTAANEHYPTATFNIALRTITYDTGTTK
jgi:hypothetical protein